MFGTYEDTRYFIIGNPLGVKFVNKFVIHEYIGHFGIKILHLYYY